MIAVTGRRIVSDSAAVEFRLDLVDLLQRILGGAVVSLTGYELGYGYDNRV